MRKEKKWLHRISSMILSFLMVLQVFSGSFGNMQVHAQNDADIWQGIGENIGMPWNAIYITHPKYTEFKLQMFCIEAKKEFPKENAPIEYELIKPAKDDLIKKSFNQPNTNADVALEGVKRVLWNGHPWNASGLKEKYDVTEEEFQLVTTMAMQYWTDSYWGNKGSNYIHDNHEAFKIDSQRKREKKLLLVDMFKELVGLGEYVLSDPPSDAEFLLGVPHGVEYARSYQKILSMDLKKYPIHFIKVNENGEKISGARLKVTKLDPPFTSIAVGDDYNLEWTSDEKKEGELGYFAFGSYKLEEIKTPDGGYVPFDKFNFNIVPGGKIEFPGGKPSYVTGVETRIEELNGYEQTVSYFTIKNEKTEAPKPQYKDGKLKTTVKVDNKQATKEELEAGKNLTVVIADKKAKKNVVDTVAYSDLVGGVEYELTGKLMKVVGDKEPEQVGKEVKQTFTAEENGSGTVEMTFSDVEIEAGVKYVVFEEAVSKTDIEFKDKTEKHKVTHHDKNDKSQTFNVEKEKPQEPEVTKVSVKKVWNVKEGTTVPAQVVIRLMPANQTLTLNADNNWQGEFTNLPLKGDDGQVINYVVSEDEVTGFTTEITGNKETGFVVTNTPEEVTPEIEKIEIPVTKVWSPNTPQDKMPQEITVVLDQTQERLVLNAENGWKGKFENLPKTTEDAKTIDYTISEVEVEGFTSKITGNVAIGFIVINTYDEPEEPQTDKINIPVQKIWNVKEGETLPESVEITLQPTGDKLVLSAENQWKGEFTDLPKVNEEGEEITYTITETAVKGYKTGITGDQLNGFTVTNTKEEVEKPEVTEVSVKKVWNAKEGTKIPESIRVVLEQTGESVVLSAENEWKASFKNLKAKDEQGNTITYTVKEVEVEGFISTVSGNMKEGYVIVNTEKPVTPDEPQKPETRDITVTKKWVGESLEKVVVYLMADGKKIDEVILNKENGWSHTFKGLDKTKDGKEISYTVEEQEVKGYTVKVEGNIEKGFIITNTKEDPKIPDEPKPNVPNDPGHEEPKNPAPKTPNDRGNVLPKTGDASDIGLYGLSGVLSLVGLILIRRKRKEV